MTLAHIVKCILSTKFNEFIIKMSKKIIFFAHLKPFKYGTWISDVNSDETVFYMPRFITVRSQFSMKKYQKSHYWPITET